MASRARIARASQVAAVALAAAPALLLARDFANDALGANPIEALSHASGLWALRWLLLSLAVTPARRWLALAWLAPLRRTLGLAAFAWACAHLAIFAFLDHGLAWREMWEDLLERRYISAGATAWLLLLPLALTSTRGMQRRLGRRWQQLHRLVYPAAACAVLHFVWLVKADLLEPAAYAAALAALLAARAWPARGRTAAPMSRSGAAR